MRSMRLLVRGGFRKVFPVLIGGLAFLGGEASSVAGVFDLVHFLEPGDFSLGLEPQLNLSNGTGLGANLKYTQGLNEFMNVAGILGTSSGERKFRLGGQLTFDFFPDVEGQPGIGVTTSAIYHRFTEYGQMEFMAIPYIHKAFRSSNNEEIEPFLAVPVGVALSQGRYQAMSSVSLGSLFKSSEHLRFVLEMGVAVNNSQSYLSGGVVYYH